jgi:thymidylate kinase
METVEASGSRGRKIRRVMEIIGPAGAGKTTLYRALKAHEEQVVLSDFPDVRKLSAAPFFIRYCLGLVPTLARIYQRPSRQVSRRELAWMAVLRGWPSILQKQARNGNRAIVLDQGPVYLMAELRESGPEYLRNQKAEIFWQSSYHRWANTLDVIVWLDTNDASLLERIRSRQQEHMMKDENDSAVVEFLARFRKNYEEVVARLEANSSNLRVLRFDTSNLRPDKITARVLAELSD